MANFSQGYAPLVNSKTLAELKGNGEAIQGIKHNFEAAAAPGVGDDVTEGYSAGSMWIINQAGDATDGDVYICSDASDGAAVWQLVHDATP